MIHLEKLRSYLQLADDVDVGPAFELMENVLAHVSERTARYFGEIKLHTERFVGGEQTIWLTETPLVDVDHVLLVEQGAGATWTTIDAADYEVVGRTLVGISFWPQATTGYPPKNIRVSYYAGYEFGSLPGDIEQMVLEMTAQRWLDRGHENLRSESIGDGYSYTRAAGVTGESVQSKEWEKIISLWRPPVFA